MNMLYNVQCDDQKKRNDEVLWMKKRQINSTDLQTTYTDEFDTIQNRLDSIKTLSVACNVKQYVDNVSTNDHNYVQGLKNCNISR